MCNKHTDSRSVAYWHRNKTDASGKCPCGAADVRFLYIQPWFSRITTHPILAISAYQAVAAERRISAYRHIPVCHRISAYPRI